MSVDLDRRVVLKRGALELELAPELGGAVAAYRWRGENGSVALFRETPDGATDVLQTGCFPLVPYCNRVRDGRFAFRGREVRLSPNLPPQPHPLHGQGWREPWSVEEHGEASCALAFEHPAGEWPWRYQARQTFTLDQEGLKVVLACRNLSNDPMPCGLGFHPFFDAPADTVLNAEVTAVWTVDDEIMPVERVAASGRYSLVARPIARAGLDNGYDGWTGEATVEWPARQAGVRIRCREARRFQVYAPEAQAVLCAEPVTNANDAFRYPEEEWPDLGVAILVRGEIATLTARFDPLIR